MLTATTMEVEAGTLGACLKCEERVEGVEPDARKYECPYCHEKAVYGLEELLLTGQLKVHCEE